MEQLQQLNRDLGYPSGPVLLKAVRKKDIDVSKQQVLDLAAGDSVRQTFGQRIPQKGHVASTKRNDTWEADIIDQTGMQKDKNDGYQVIFVITDVFTRITHGEATRTRRPQDIWSAFERIIAKFGAKCSKLNVDDDGSYTKEFEAGCERENIVLQKHFSRNPNKTPIVDSAIKRIKEGLYRFISKSGDSTNFIDHVQKAIKAANDQPHSALLNESPNDAAQSNVVTFRKYQDNGLIIKQNAKQLQQRQERLRNFGFFRALLPKKSRDRAFLPKFSGTVKTVKEIKGGVVIDTNDNRYDIATVLPVAQGSQEVSSAAIARGGQAKKERQRQEMEQFVPRVKEVLGTNVKNLSHISTEIKRIPGFQQAFERAFGKHIGIKQFFDLFPTHFGFSGTERNPKVSVRRTRLRGKRPTS